MSRPKFAAIPIEVLTSEALSPGAKVLYGMLSSASGYPTYNQPSWYSEAKLAEILSTPLRTLQRQKAELEHMNLIERDRMRQFNSCTIWLKDLTAETIEKLRPGISEGPRRIVEPTVEEARTVVLEKGNRHQWREATATSGGTPTLYMKHNNETNSAEGKPPARSSIQDSMTRASKINKKTRTRAEKRFDRVEERKKAQAQKRADHWGPSKFIEYISEICALNAVELRENTTASGVPSKALGAQMRMILDIHAEVGLDKNQTVDMINWLIKGWHEGLSERFSRDGTFSIFILRYKIRELEKLFRAKSLPREPEQKQKPMTVDEFINDID